MAYRWTRQPAGWLLLLLLIAAGVTTGQARPASPGTPAVMIKDINPTPGQDSAPSDIVALGALTLFVADDGVHGRELWRSDGTAAGTTLVRDLNPATDWRGPNNLLVVNGVLLFSVNDGVHGEELWRSDGTAAGTRLVKDIRPGPLSGRVSHDSTVLLNGVAIFRADDGRGLELWRSDGTAAGTRLIKDVHPGPGSAWEDALNWAINGPWLYLPLDDGTHGRELWRTDGTAAGTTLVNDLRPGPDGSWPRDVLAVDDHVYFLADDGQGGDFGIALWQTDGTAAGTLQVRPPNGDVLYNAFLMQAGGRLYIGSLLTPRGGCSLQTLTEVVGTFAHCALLTAVNDQVLFRGDGGPDDLGVELWETDGSAAGTSVVKDIYPGGTGSDPQELIAAAGWLYFTADDGVHGQELWRSDGSAAGTVLVQDLNPTSGAVGDGPRGLTIQGERLLFSANDGVHGQELWALPLTRRWTHQVFVPLAQR